MGRHTSRKNSIETTEPCLYLDWDSDFFGCRIAKIITNYLTLELIGRVLAWCHEREIDCLYFLSNTDDRETLRLAEDNRFQLMDIRLTFDRQIDTIPEHLATTRFCTANDVPALQAIARVSYHDTRFYYDDHFPNNLCDRLYEIWIARSCADYADAVLIAEMQGDPVGFISCHLEDNETGRIGLVGVREDARDCGIGQQLVYNALRWFSEQHTKRVTVATQGRNYAAQRLYQKCGFLTNSVQLWYHRWFV